MNKDDARFIIGEIRNMEYYARNADSLKKRIDEIQLQIETATDPKSPQGYENIGAGRSLLFAGKEAYIAAKITEKDELTIYYKKLAERFIDAQRYYFEILDNTEEKEFVQDYFNNQLSRQQLEEKYHINKARRKMIQIIIDVARSGKLKLYTGK